MVVEWAVSSGAGGLQRMSPGQDAMNGPPGNRTGTYRIDNDDKGAPVVNGSKKTRTSLTMALAPFEMPALISRL